MSDHALAVSAALERAEGLTREGAPARAATARALLELAGAIAESRGLAPARAGSGRLGALAGGPVAPPPFPAAAPLPTELLAIVLERAWDGPPLGPGGLRAQRRTSRRDAGAHFTPAGWAGGVAEAALSSVLGALAGVPAARRAAALAALRVADPACGAGTLLAAVARVVARELERAGMDARRARATAARQCVVGVDLDELAIATTEVVLWLEAGGGELEPRDLGGNLRHGDALFGAPTPGERAGSSRPRTARGGSPAVDWRELLGARRGFDAVVGNPPWISFAGRGGRRLAPAARAAFAARFRSFGGYPTLHSVFVERATELAPEGTVALLLPSALSDLPGYGRAREALTSTHRPREPLVELGDGAFEGVVQPSFLLVADSAPGGTPTPRPLRLLERARPACAAVEITVPAALARIAAGAPLPRGLFGELGFRSTAASRGLLVRGPSEGTAPADGRQRRPLLEGKDVREFAVGRPRLFLDEDPQRLSAAGARLAAAERFGEVRFVVRQTAPHPIAALHSGVSFRNSLLAGFDHPACPPALTVGLLNSALYRALHRLRSRDSRQPAFPQVKLAHLRALPAPPEDPEARERVAQLVREGSRRGGLGPEERLALDDAVFDLFGVAEGERDSIRRTTSQASPRAPC